MLSYTHIYEKIESTRLRPWLNTLPGRVERSLQSNRWGDLPKWLEAIEALPDIVPSSVELCAGSIRIGSRDDCDEATRLSMEHALRRLHPWRKGPFDLFGIRIDTEWRSDLKWDRLKDHIAPLDGRLVLDVGCGNGYHCWRMLGEGAQMVLGADPTMLYVIQFQAVQKYINNASVSVLPVGVDDLPDDLECFDTVFSMGLLYHRRSPLDHLLQLRSFLRNGGELVLETLVIDGKEGEILNPQGRYARMPNVWFIPSPGTLESWLKRVGFRNINLVDVTKTTSEEQRVTGWMGFQSLADFLDPHNPDVTVEGYPAPRRAIFLAQKL